MGDDGGPENEHPIHIVFLDAYWISRCEVTHAQYRRFLVATGTPAPPYWRGYEYPPGMGDCPVVGVTWEEAAACCAWAGGRLPTEAEWEKAARGVDGRTYPWGNEWDPTKANVDNKGEGSLGFPETCKDMVLAWELLAAGAAHATAWCLRPVGSFPEGASPFGVLDMAGNASEWVSDWYNWAGYFGLPDRNPVVTGPSWNHGVRGSAWFYPYAIARWAPSLSRCSARNSSHASRDPRVGFRCAFDIACPTPVIGH